MKKNALLCLIAFVMFSIPASAYETDVIKETPNVRANMVIILDNSLSMFTSCEGPKGFYDKNIEYGGPSVTAPYDKNKYYKSDVQLIERTDFISNIAIFERSKSFVQEKVNISDLEKMGIIPYTDWVGTTDYFYTGNYLNYFFESRINFAKRSLINLMEKIEVKKQEGKTAGISYAIMTYNKWEDGGTFESVIEDCADRETQCSISHLKQIKTAVAKSSTAEALRETGFYFQGVKSIYDRSKDYRSPIEYKCQPNLALIVSDGGRAFDQNYDFWWPWNNVYKLEDKGETIDYLDDVAEQLYNTDLRDDLEGKQNIVTLTAGFQHIPVIGPMRDVGLKSAAQRGGGDYIQLNDVEDLYVFIENFMNFQLRSEASSYGLAIPPDDDNSNYSGDFAYMSMFKPLNFQGRWIGNIKKFRFQNDGTLSSSDEWTGINSPDVEIGGVRQKLVQKKEADRKIYTTKNYSTNPVEFKSSSFSSTEKSTYNFSDELITNVRCGGVCREGNLLSDYALGDIVHFTPLVHKFRSNRVVFAGANDGMLHCFNDDTTSTDYGAEMWAYIPEKQLPNLAKLLSNRNPEHPYFIDGGRTIYQPKNDNGTAKDYSLLIFGERRGGKNYYALQINNERPDAPPKLQYTVEPGDSFGQSWSNPRVVPIVYNGAKKDAFFIGGGYDKTYHEDLRDSEKSNYTKKGNGIYAILADSEGSKASLDLIGIPNTGISDCILDPVSFNPGYEYSMQDNIDDNPSLMADSHSRVYACDMAGNLWGFRDDSDFTLTSGISTSHLPGAKDGVWSNMKVFESDVALKVFQRPEVVLDQFTEIEEKDGNIVKINKYNGEYVLFGTGDREAPSTTQLANKNRFYSIKNCWNSDYPIVINDLENVTFSIAGPSVDKKGWYIELENDGEKVMSYPLAFNGIVFFTTYTPAPDINSDTNNGRGHDDPCDGIFNVGTARLYALNLKTGAPVLNLSIKGQGNDGEVDETSDNPLPLCKSDRSVEIGRGVPGVPQLIFPKDGGAKITAGVGNRLYSKSLDFRDMTVFYWKEKR